MIRDFKKQLINELKNVEPKDIFLLIAFSGLGFIFIKLIPFLLAESVFLCFLALVIWLTWGAHYVY